MYTLLATFRFMYYFSKLIGVAPISDAGNNVYRLSLPALLYSIGLTLLVACGSLLQIHRGWTYDPFENGVVVEAGFHVVHLVSSLHYTMAIVLGWLRWRQLARITTNMFFFNNLLANPNIISNTKFSIFMFKIFLAILYFTVVSIQNRNILPDFYTILSFVEYGFLIFSTYFILIQFTGFVQFYSLYFKIINTQLEQAMPELLTNLSKHIDQLWTAIPRKRHGIKLSSVSPVGRSLKGSFSLQKLVELHGEVSDEVTRVNAAYSIQLLLGTADRFVSFTLCVFCVFVSLFSKDAKQNIPVYITICAWSVVNLFITVLACTSCSREANRTAILVHKQLIKTKDPALQEELRQFSLQLLHRKVQFTACGFFPLDFTLLYSIVGAVTTYLVILIQFQLSFSNTKQGNATRIV